MRVRKVFVNIAGGTEDAGGIGHVLMRHGQEYSISVSSDFDQPSNAEIEIDGKLAGTWRIQAHGQINIERPANAERKFTFYRHGTSEAESLDRINSTVAGVISVRVIPGRALYSYLIQEPVMKSFGGIGGQATRGPSSGQTGLGAASYQRFGTAREIELDYDQAITVNLRLYCSDAENRPSTLRDVRFRSNPVPQEVR